jgi:hypothetical protein
MALQTLATFLVSSKVDLIFATFHSLTRQDQSIPFFRMFRFAVKPGKRQRSSAYLVAGNPQSLPLLRGSMIQQAVQS